MTQLVKEVPYVYVAESRDFQVLLRTYTLTLNYLSFFIDSLRNVSDTKRCLSNTLHWLKTRLGFFCDDSLNTDILRKVLIAFPDIMKWKGSLKGILLATILYTNIYNINTNISVEYDKESGIIYIFSDVGFEDVTLLEEILKYIIPTGVIVKYMYTDIDTTTSNTYIYSDSYVMIEDSNQESSLLYKQGEYTNNVKNRNIESLDTFTLYQQGND